MAGCRGLVSSFKRRRKQKSSSRLNAMRSKKPLGDSASTTTALTSQSEASPPYRASALSFTVLFLALVNIMQRFWQRVAHMCFGFLGPFLFWREHATRLESLHTKVEGLQREVASLRSIVEEFRSEKLFHGTKTRSPCKTPSVHISAPPPPPPPPPLPLPSLTVTAPKVSLMPHKKAQPASVKEKLDVPAAVTLRDLQAVRLKKVTVNRKMQASPESRRAPLVTLADLQKVSLRRSSSFKSIERSPKKCLRVPLRKVNLLRSPGGTPRHQNENHVTDSFLDSCLSKASRSPPTVDIHSFSRSRTVFICE